MVNYFESLRKISKLKFLEREPMYWVQYAMLKIDNMDYSGAQENINIAYKNIANRDNYDTSAIDNQQARLYLLLSIKKETSADKAYKFFLKADKLLQLEKNIRYVTKLILMYKDFYISKFDILPKKDKIEFLKIIKLKYRHVHNLKRENEHFTRKDDIHLACESNLKFILEQEEKEHIAIDVIKEKLYDDLYEELSRKIKVKFKDYDLDPDYLSGGIGEAIVRELYMPETLKLKNLVNNNDTYILDISFETEASVWLLIDKNHHDYIARRPIPVREHNKQYYSTESEETLSIELSVEFNIDANQKIKNLDIDSIEEVVLLEDEHLEEREDEIKNEIIGELKDIFKTLRIDELDHYQIHDSSLPSDDNSAIITAYDVAKTIEIEDIEIFSNQFNTMIYMEQEVYLDINIFKSDYYENDEYSSLYGNAEELNDHYVTVEAKALVAVNLDVHGTRDTSSNIKENLATEINNISIVELLPVNENHNDIEERIMRDE